ncbi:MAG: hypothetical protein ACI8PZ_001563 [Myxococcota bacterium]
MATGLFKVESAYFHPGYDLVVLTGEVLQHPVRAGLHVDLPREAGGPGWVPIASLEFVRFPLGERLALTVSYTSIRHTPLEPTSLEGRELEVRQR